MEKNTKRIKWIDIAKCIGIFLIALGHTLRFGKIHFITYSFSVPLFFVISGLTFKKQKQLEFVKNKFLKIIIPYFIFSLISILIYFVLGKYVSGALSSSADDFGITNNIIYGMLLGNPRYGYMRWNAPLWFLPAYFIALLFINTFELFIEKSNKKIFHRIIYITLCVLITIFYKNYLLDLCLPWYIEGCFILSSYVEIGIILKDFIIKLSNKQNLMFSLLFLIIGLIIAINNNECDISLLSFGNSLLFYYIGSILLSLFIILVSIRINKCNILELVGKNSFGIMCFHKFPVLFFQTVFPYTKNILNSYSDTLVTNIIGILVTIISIILCILVIYVIMLVFPYALGKDKRYNIFNE